MIPLAATRLADTGVLLSPTEAGKTDTSAPVSTNKDHPDKLSVTDREPTLESIEDMAGDEVPGVSPSWRVRFPKEENA